MTLYVVPTPIGNLEDITLRALRILRESDAVACEDTRRTGQLLKHYEIDAKLVAYHDHNERRLAPELAERAKTEVISLVSDAGMPLVSDPGYEVVRACIEAGVKVEVLPGASAMTTALVASGLPADTVTFVGFPAKKGREHSELFRRISTEEATFVLYESPKRLVKTLTELPQGSPVAVCRELTKLHEEVFRGTVSEAAGHFSGDVKGEVVIVIRGSEKPANATIEEAVALAGEYLKAGEGKSRAASRAAKETGFRKGEVYDLLVSADA